MFTVIPLGVSSALPGLDRHFSSTALVREGELFLFDCGEGTQLQLLRAGLRPTRLAGIFITHAHGDHVFGLPGLLSTLGLLEYSRTLTVVAPAGLREALEAFVKPTSSHGRPYPIDFVALEPGFERAIVRETPAYHVVARPLEHSLFTVGYRFEEKPRPGTLDVERAHALGVKKGTDFGRLKAGDSVKVLGWTVRPDDVLGPAHPGASFAYVTDTRPCAGGRRLAECADLVYHEATFRERDADRALETRHATAREAAEVARDAGARRLLIGHFSARYEAADLDGLLGEARAIFQNTEAADELKRYPIEAASRADSNLATD